MRQLVAPTGAGDLLRKPPTRSLRVIASMLLIVLVVVFFAAGAERLLSLDALRADERWLAAVGARHPLLFAGTYLLVYTVVAGLSLPGALPLTVAGGAWFGLAEGTVLVSFASGIGALLALVGTRWLFEDVVRRNFARRLDQINRGLERDGGAFLLSLHLVPAVPFVLVNLLFGVTGFSAFRFYWISQLGMLPATLVYVNAGTQLGHIRTLAGILSPSVLVSLLLLAALPLATRAVAHGLRRRN